MEDFKVEELTIHIEEQGETVVMSWIGKSRMKEPSQFLIPFVNTFIPKIGKRSLVIDFYPLQSINSSSVNPIIYLIKKLEEDKISTELQVEKSSEWKAASFKAIENFTRKFNYVKLVWK